MKRILLKISLLFVVATTAIISLSSWHCAPLQIASYNLVNTTTDDDWTLIGEVTLSNYYNSSETIKANLYVREFGNNLIYRVEYQGTYYATRWHDHSNTYHVTINGITYRCDVPSISNGNASTNQSQNKFIGVWKSTEQGTRNFGDIQISNNEGKLFVQIKKTNGLKAVFASPNNDYLKWSVDVYEDYGKWRVGIYESYVGQVIVGDGYTYTDRIKPNGSVPKEYSQANKEVMRECYTAWIKDGNLHITVSYRFLYYNDEKYCFDCNGDIKIQDVIYTKW